MKHQQKYVALYERLSHDDEQLGESNSISHQKEMLEEYARNHGIINYRHFTDDGISGTRFDRPSFLEMMEQVKQGRISRICIKDMSRMGRDYLQVGQLMEMLRQKGVMLVAINDGVDTSKGDDDFVPFRNIMNEWYAKDTSKKIKSVFQAKGRSGKHVASSPPYGYFKSKDDPNQWIVDEETAKVIRRSFQLTLEGLGPYQVTRILKKEEIPIPAVHMNKLGVGNHRGREIRDPYNWSSATVVGILERREYLGHTVNFKTKSTLKTLTATVWTRTSGLSLRIPRSLSLIRRPSIWFRRSGATCVTRWPNGWGPAHPLTGLVYCADCGGKLYCHRIDNGRRVNVFSCGNYPQKKCASGHRINGNDLLQIVSQTLKAVHDYIQAVTVR